MELVNSGTVEMLSRRSVAIKDYENEDEDGDCDESDRASLKIDLSMAEQFYYEVISSFEQEEVDSPRCASFDSLAGDIPFPLLVFHFGPNLSGKARFANIIFLRCKSGDEASKNFAARMLFFNLKRQRVRSDIVRRIVFACANEFCKLGNGMKTGGSLVRDFERSIQE